jgi:hypothetical protein
MCKENMKTDLLLLGLSEEDSIWLDAELVEDTIGDNDFCFDDEEKYLDDWDEFNFDDDLEELSDKDTSWKEMSYNRFNRDSIVYGEA